MNIFITGGSGLIGSNLVPLLNPYRITVLTRNVAMAEKILGHKINFVSDIDKLERLKVELSTPRRSTSKRGLDMVETKDQLKKRKVASPNLADAFIMGACPHLAEQSNLVFAC